MGSFRAALKTEGPWIPEGCAWVDCTSCILFESRTALHCAVFRINPTTPLYVKLLHKRDLIASQCAHYIFVSMSRSPNVMPGTDSRSQSTVLEYIVLSHIFHFRMQVVDNHRTKVIFFVYLPSLLLWPRLLLMISPLQYGENFKKSYISDLWGKWLWAQRFGNWSRHDFSSLGKDGIRWGHSQKSWMRSVRVCVVPCTAVI